MNEAIERYHDGLAPADQSTCARLAAAIEGGLVGAEGKVWHAHSVWFLDDNPIVGYAKRKDAVRLLFWSGQSFDEPDLEPEGTFKAAQARFTAADQIDDEALARWLRKVVDIQWDYKNLVKRKGRLERLKRGAAPAPAGRPPPAVHLAPAPGRGGWAAAAGCPPRA